MSKLIRCYGQHIWLGGLSGLILKRIWWGKIYCLEFSVKICGANINPRLEMFNTYNGQDPTTEPHLKAPSSMWH